MFVDLNTDERLPVRRAEWLNGSTAAFEQVLKEDGNQSTASLGLRNACPLVPLVPLLGIVFCLLLMFSLPPENWLRLVIWLLLGFAVYFGYGRHHSVMARMQNKAAPTEADPA